MGGDAGRADVAERHRGDPREAQQVIDLSVASYHAAGHRTRTRDLPPPVSVYVPALRRAEVVVDHDCDALGPQALAAVAALSRRGIEVHVLAPLGTIGALRGALRDRAAQIQGWWRDDVGAIKFDAPRIP